MIAVIAEEKGYFKAEEIIKSVNSKFKRRKPFILVPKSVSIDEEISIWNFEKAKEKKK